MNLTRTFAAPLGLAVAAGLSACFSAPSRTDSNPAAELPPVVLTPPLPDSVPDAMPRIEKRSRNGNPPFYEVFGKRYFVLSSSVGYVERGVASWYGPGFHKVRTSTGESYDM
ncbi:MAG: septal ring lytic transglycosylase RlpA family lipoprotein, partial [Pseudomonadota bacterium]|nr:septal ring lytic transglycosylase RlpA family lipoprotein [Pseudomonadota bacterium]